MALCGSSDHSVRWIYRWIAPGSSGAFASAPYQCGELAGINTAMGQMQQGTASLAMAGALGHGLRMQVSDMAFDLASGAPPRFSGRVVVASNSPQGLLGMASMQMPALASAGLGRRVQRT